MNDKLAIHRELQKAVHKHREATAHRDWTEPESCLGKKFEIPNGEMSKDKIDCSI